MDSRAKANAETMLVSVESLSLVLYIKGFRGRTDALLDFFLCQVEEAFPNVVCSIPNCNTDFASRPVFLDVSENSSNVRIGIAFDREGCNLFAQGIREQ